MSTDDLVVKGGGIPSAVHLARLFWVCVLVSRCGTFLSFVLRKNLRSPALGPLARSLGRSRYLVAEEGRY